jgi:transposase-like protein
MATCKHERLAQEIGIPKSQLYSWRKDLQRLQKIAAERGSSNERMLRNENRRLKEALVGKVMEADFLQGVLRGIEARRQPSSGSGETASIERSR